MTRKYKIKFNKENKLTIPDAFDTVGQAEHFIRNWSLDKYEPEIIRINKEQEYDLTDDGTGKKYDTGKSMVGTLSRVFSRALLGVGNCITFGTSKYPKPDNWKLVEGAFERYQDSMMRHYLKFLSGEERDSETNILHLCHMAWNALAITELYLMNHPEYDKELFK